MRPAQSWRENSCSVDENMSGNLASRRGGGSFRVRLQSVEDIQIKDLDNPLNFYHVFMSSETVVNNWFRNNNLLPTLVKCPSKVKIGTNDDGSYIYENCGGDMYLKEHGGKPGNSTFRCTNNRNHERCIRYLSYFENSNLTIPDIMVFIKSYLDKLTLRQCSVFGGMSYKSTAVNWASFLRELFKEHFHSSIKERTISGEIEIDESLFGRKIKYHRGNPHPGLRIWIFGLVERKSNTIILYPVGDRSKDTLIPLIQHHIAPGSTIYSDGWSAYCDLNSLSYDHFTVLHKYCFKKVYVNQTTNQTVVCHTNAIEGALKHAKDHSRKMAGTQLSQFEGHMAEIVWRSEAKGNLYNSFFNLLRSVYTLQRPAEYHYTTLLFDSWNMEPQTDTPIAEVSIQPTYSDAETEALSQSDKEVATEAAVNISSYDSGSDIPPNLPVNVQSTSRMPGAISSSELHSMFSSAASDESEIPPNLPAVAMPSTSATPGEISPSEICIMLSSTSISD